MGKTQPPTGHAVRFAEPVDHQRVWIVLGWRNEGPVVAEGAIDLVADEHHVALGGQFGQPAHLFLAGHDAGGIGGAVEDDRLRPRRDSIGHPLQIDAEIGIGVDVNRLAADHLRKGIIHHEAGIENDHLFARIEEHHERQHQPAAGARSYKQLAVVVAVLRVHLRLKFLAQHGHAL